MRYRPECLMAIFGSFAFVLIGGSHTSSVFGAPIVVTASSTIPKDSRIIGIPDSMFSAGDIKFSIAKGSIGAEIRNQSKTNTIKDLEITAPQGMTFDPSSNGGGGALFPTTTFSPDNKMLTFTGGNVGPNNSFFLKIPEGDYPSGMITPQQQKPKDMKQNSVPPAGKSEKSLSVSYDGAGTFSFQPAIMHSVQYKDGTIATMNSASENIIGSEIDITPMQLMGSSPDIPGASQLSDSLLTIVQGGDVVLSATLADALLIPDTSFPGFDTTIQAILMWQNQESPDVFVSRYLDELFDSLPGTPGALFLFNSLLLANTDNLAHSGSSVGPVEINAFATPEPGNLVLLGTGVLGLGDMCRRKLAKGSMRRKLM